MTAEVAALRVLVAAQRELIRAQQAAGHRWGDGPHGEWTRIGVAKRAVVEAEAVAQAAGVSL